MPYVGRLAERAKLDRAIDRALDGNGVLVRIVGEAGIGKTRLADEAAAQASTRGMRVLWGRCWEAGGAPPFWPWSQLLRGLGAEAVLAAESKPSSSSADAEASRFVVFDAVLRVLADESAKTPLMLVLDDMHAADVPSIELLRFVARGLRPTRILVIVTQREVEARMRPQIGDTLAKIARDGETLVLPRLAPAEVATWLEEEGRDPAAAPRVHLATEGNPLFVQEILAASGGREVDVRLPDAVEAVIAEHVGRLPPRARAVLEVAAVLGRETTTSELARLAEAPDLDDVVRAATSLGIVESRGDVIAFRHILFRDELHRGLAAATRAAIHGAAAARYARLGEAGDDDALSRAAHHELEAARAGGDIGRAASRARRAAERAVRRHAYEEAAALLERAIKLLEDDGALDDPRGCEMLVDWAEALVLSGLGSRGRDIAARAAAMAKAIGEKRLLVRSALVYGSEILTARRDERMVALLRDALEAVGTEPSADRAWVMARLSSALVPAPSDDREPDTLSTAAIAMARALGDRHALLPVLQFAIMGTAFRLTSAERGALMDEVTDLAFELDRPSVAMMTISWALASALERGETALADRRIIELERLVKAMPQATYRVRLPLARATRASLEGRWEQADALLAEVEAIAEASESPQPRFLLAFGRLSRHHARPERERLLADEALVLGAVRSVEAAVVFEALYRALMVDVGLYDRERVVAFLRSEVAPRFSLFNGVVPAAGPLGYAALLARDHELAEAILPTLLASAEACPLIFLAGCAGSLGPTSLLLAELLVFTGRSKEDAARHYAAAIAVADAIGARVYADRARAALGTVDSAMPRPKPATPPTIELRREGEIWTLAAGGEAIRLKDSKGLAYLALLLAHRGEEIHVTQLVGAGEESLGDAGPMLDEAAKASYRRRATDLREVLDEATRNADFGRAERAREELEALGNELARAVGLGGRDRRAASAVERMRINVQRRLKDVIGRVAAHDPAIGRYLDASIRTGTFCSYVPAWDKPP